MLFLLLVCCFLSEIYPVRLSPSFGGAGGGFLLRRLDELPIEKSAQSCSNNDIDRVNA